LLEEKKIKRFFSVNNKLIVENGVYHVTQRAPGKERLFLEETDYLYFIHLLKNSSKKFKIDIYSFVLMPNHIHILLHLNEKNLDKGMKEIFQKYAIYFNKKYHRKGHVFCGAYRCALCNDEKYILAVSIYIHLNPLKANIVKSASRYRWSSIKVYLDSDISSFVKNDFILELLSVSKNEAVKRYKDILNENSRIQYSSRLETFKEWKKTFQILRDSLKDLKISKKMPLDADLQSLEDKINDLRENKKLNYSRDRETLLYIIEQLQSRGFNINEISNVLGVSRWKVYRLQQK